MKMKRGALQRLASTVSGHDKQNRRATFFTSGRGSDSFIGVMDFHRNNVETGDLSTPCSKRHYVACADTRRWKYSVPN